MKVDSESDMASHSFWIVKTEYDMAEVHNKYTIDSRESRTVNREKYTIQNKQQIVNT